jgi:phage shock protein A
MGRLWQIIRGWWYRIIGKAEEANPRAILEAQIADFQKNSAQFNENLAKQAGMIERLKNQVAAEEKKVELMTARASAAYAAGQMEKAGQMALQIKDTKREIDENKKQLIASEELFKNLSRQRDVYLKQARERIDAVKSKISKAEMAEAQAKLGEMASNVSFSPDGTGINALEEKLDERIANAQGKVRVASEQVASQEWTATEGEQKALEGAALAEFAREMGFAPAQAPVAPMAAPRDLGPADDITSNKVSA